MPGRKETPAPEFFRPHLRDLTRYYTNKSSDSRVLLDMGGAVSSGRDNEELVDNLCYEGYIHEPLVEEVFRMIDRADYMIFQDDEEKLEAYEDHAWRKGTLHLSAPCIYTRVIEALKFEKGVSFLNIGSGTGYLSTMAGLLIGPYGINHGIEIYQENIDYAYEKLTEFREKSQWYDPVKFCEPLFVVGNGLLLSPGNILYDRIYCGAACPPEHAQLMKNMLTLGGTLVMPHENQLESITRASETEWTTDVVLPSVSFAPLILPSQESVKDLAALEIAVEPHSLKHLCRLKVLQELGRPNYNKTTELPLPKRLKEYISHYREWDTAVQSLKTLCPIDRNKESEEDGSKDNNNVHRTRRQSDAARGHDHPPLAQAIMLNGRRVLLCNFNGVTFQVPIESDDSDDDRLQLNSDHESEEEEVKFDDDTKNGGIPSINNHDHNGLVPHNDGGGEDMEHSQSDHQSEELLESSGEYADCKVDSMEQEDPPPSSTL